MLLPEMLNRNSCDTLCTPEVLERKGRACLIEPVHGGSGGLVTIRLQVYDGGCRIALQHTPEVGGR